MNLPLGIAAFLCVAGVGGHYVSFEFWMWPFMDKTRFPTTPIGDAIASKDIVRIVWHYFTIDWLITLYLILVLLFTHQIQERVLLLQFTAVRWFLYTFIYFILAKFRWSKLKANPQWFNPLLVSICFWWASLSH
jgi:hypothetical protein